MGKYYVYFLTNAKRTVLYVGMTDDLKRRINEHKEGIRFAFTRKYKCFVLVYFETYNTPEKALKREKQLKNWHREWKQNLILKRNPEWKEINI